MKKVLSIVLVVVLLMSLLTACGKPAEKEEGKNGGDELVAGKIVKIGLGNLISIASSEDAYEDQGPVGQADVYAAAVGFDADGKIVSISIDTAQTQVKFGQDGKFITDVSQAPKTKKELGFDYNMKKFFSEAHGIGKEWFEQIEALEEWMVGKTVAEVAGMKFKENPAGYPDAPDVPELESSVSISVTSYLALVAEAWDNAIDVVGGESLGLGLATDISSSQEAGDGEGAIAQVDTTMIAAAIDAEGTVVGSLIDTAQVVMKFDEDGILAMDREEEVKTKKELGFDYNMKKFFSDAHGIGKEWFEQIEALEEWMVGRTLEEITGMKFKENPAGYPDAPDVPELESSVTISVTNYLNLVDMAAQAAR